MGSVRGKKQEKCFYLTGRCVNEDFSPPSIGGSVSLQFGGTTIDINVIILIFNGEAIATASE